MAGRSAKHTAFDGWVAASTAKWRALVWGDDAASTSAGSRLRIRAVDPYHKTSAWVVSEPFTVVENAYPRALAPEADELTGNTPHLVWTVEDADGDGIHVEASSPDSLHLRLVLEVGARTDGWEEAADARDLDGPSPAGATSGNRVRFQCPPSLRHLRLTWRLFDGILYSVVSPH